MTDDPKPPAPYETWRMRAYYYGFDRTGEPCIDLILSAVACAGKAFHHTDGWTDSSPLYNDAHRGETPVQWIQFAADDARAELAALRERVRTHRAVVESRDALQGMVDRLVPESVRIQDGTVSGAERWLSARLGEIDWERIGQECINAIIQGGMIRILGEEDRSHVFVWNGNAAEQIGEHLKRAALEEKP